MQERAKNVNGCRTEIFTIVVGQSCRSALNSRAARQRRPTIGVKMFVLRPRHGALSRQMLVKNL